jgi:oxygen-independent coproporphyrinogen-3 oxidase
MTASAYIHIPFCSHKCDFCDFAAFAGMDHLEDQYASVVCEEISARLKDATGKKRMQTIFYGGGTPGLVKAETVGRIHERLVQESGIDQSAEVTIETTPHAITADKVGDWMQIGINRISVGVESLQDSELKAIGRDHTRAQAYEGVRLACMNGCENVSCDFMYALPTQTLVSWQSTLADFVSLAREFPQIKHVSAYGLHLANNSPLFSRFPKTSDAYPSDETFEQMYQTLVETLANAGFHQYEVSNFCKDGFHSTHNLSYWQNAQYYGFGVSAHRYVQRIRSSNWRSLARYMKDFLGDETTETIDAATRMREAIMLGLRMRSGIDLGQFQTEFALDLVLARKKPLEKLLALAFVEIRDGRLRITQKGVPVSNSIIAELI